jgi:hypothetical protein
VWHRWGRCGTDARSGKIIVAFTCGNASVLGEVWHGFGRCGTRCGTKIIGRLACGNSRCGTFGTPKPGLRVPGCPEKRPGSWWRCGTEQLCHRRATPRKVVPHLGGSGTVARPLYIGHFYTYLTLCIRPHPPGIYRELSAFPPRVWHTQIPRKPVPHVPHLQTISPTGSGTPTQQPAGNPCQTSSTSPHRLTTRPPTQTRTEYGESHAEARP